MPGSGSAFIPTINAITTSQDLQWMVQPTVITSMSSPYSRSHPYSHPLPPLSSVAGHTALQRPGVIKTIGTTVGRRRRDEQVTVAGRVAECASKAGVWKFPPAALSRDLLAPWGSIEVCPLRCTGAGVSQGDIGCRLAGDFYCCFLIIWQDLPSLHQTLRITGPRCSLVSKASETLKLSPGFQFECLCCSRQKGTSEQAEELSRRSFPI